MQNQFTPQEHKIENPTENDIYGLTRLNQMNYLIHSLKSSESAKEREILSGIFNELFPKDILFEALR